jgi:DNA-binding CsgD family transcriptional regulator
LVLILLEGASVQEAADRLGLATDTVRKQLKSIFQKTDTRRQSDLIRHVLLSTLPGSV